MKLDWISWLIFFLGFLSGTVTTNKKSVITTLNSKWQHTSFLMEISEFLAKENEEYFWSFVNKILDNKHNKEIGQIDTPEKEYELGLRNAESFLSKARFNLLKFALSLRLNSPKIQLHYQIASEYSIESSCSIFVDVNNEITCKLKEIDALLHNSNARTNPTTYSIDHFYKLNNSTVLPIAILYGNIGKSSEFSPFHFKLLQLANEGKLIYIIRHFDKKLEQVDSLNTVGLSGYGIELAIKNTEYKAIDDSKIDKNEEEEEESDDFHGFNFKILKKNNGHLAESLQQFKLKLSEIEELAPLKQWEVADISYQAAQKIMDANPEEAFKQLTDISQNFPTRARLLVQTKVKKAFRDEVTLNQQYMSSSLEVGEGENALFLNGINIDVDSLDIFQLFNTISKEESLADAFFGMGFRREYLSILYNMDFSEDKTTTYAIDYREAYPEYINDLDKEKQYSEWGNSVKLLLQPYFPGMIRPIARNLFTLISIVDLAAPDTKILLKIIHSLYVHQVPIRFGFVFVINESSNENGEAKKASGKENVGVALLNLYNFAKSDKTPPKALDLLIKVLDEYSGSDLTVENVHKFFKNRFADQSIDDVFEADSDYDTGRKAGQAFLRRSGLQKLPKVLLNGILLDDSTLQADKIEESILSQVMKQTYPLQKAVMAGKLTNKDNVQNWIMNQPDVLPRINNRLVSEPTDFLSLFDVNPCKVKTLKEFSALKPEERAQCILENIKYLSKGDNDNTKCLNVWLVGDLNTIKGRNLLATGLKALKKLNNLNLGFIQNRKPSDTKQVSATSFIYSIIQHYSGTLAKQMLNKLLFNENVLKQALKGEFEKILINGVDIDSLKKNLLSINEEQFAIYEYFSKNDLKLATEEMGVVVNGMFFGPFDTSEIFEIEDFILLDKIFERKGAKAIAKQIDEWGVNKEDGKSSNVVLRAMSVIGKYATRKKRQFIQFENDSESIVNILAQDGSRPIIDLVAIVDPLSRGAQKLAPILQVLTNVLNCDLKLAMNPKGRLSELPLKRFYRYVLNEEPTFNSKGEILTPSVSFEDLPAKQLFTLNINSPDSWMVQPRFADYDLDNIKMESVRKLVVAKFELVNILLEGHCFDEVTGNPPRGLQYVLGTVKNPNRYDTIVMANLGYFQLKAAPGAWILRLREGKSLDIYEIKTCTESEGQTTDEAKVLIDSFIGKTVRIRVSKKAGMEKRNLLTDTESNLENNGFIQDEDEDNSIWSSISNKLIGSEKYDKINIFSLASGHLYERFLRIMILSVIKNTKHPVKFWLLNNYLSPHFREALPKMSKKYGFEFELIEYKWPRWLHQQTEKQRIMWGYKILFLDVLFPLDVKKIIFVDADQVVRADMMDLMNLDLDGASYGYTPFCESRVSMDGFRFWKQGYWRNHLAGRKYHISALYVVDLVKFRQIAAGDRLRGQYQGLSSDPNSLSNLDQDLPNNMIHQVRIKSLPQEWLWCETWCEDKSKATAKTIDLCNNPQTKEPKLDSAVRIIPEWTAYDNEIKQVLEEKETSEDLISKSDKHGEL